MYRKCATELSAQHQHQVEQTLLELMLKKPIEDISVTELCQASGVTRRVFYHLFNNKTDALHALIDHTIQDIEDFHPDTRDEVVRFFLFWKEQKKLLDALIASRQSSLLVDRLISHTVSEDYDYLYWVNANGWEQQQDVVTFNLCGLMGLIFRWHHFGYQKSAEEMAALLVRIITTPLVRGPSPEE